MEGVTAIVERRKTVMNMRSVVVERELVILMFAFQRESRRWILSCLVLEVIYMCVEREREREVQIYNESTSEVIIYSLDRKNKIK